MLGLIPLEVGALQPVYTRTVSEPNNDSGAPRSPANGTKEAGSSQPAKAASAVNTPGPTQPTPTASNSNTKPVKPDYLLGLVGCSVSINGTILKMSGGELTARLTKRCRLLLALCIRSHHPVGPICGLRLDSYKRMGTDLSLLAQALDHASSGDITILGSGDTARLSKRVFLDEAMFALAERAFPRAEPRVCETALAL